MAWAFEADVVLSFTRLASFLYVTSEGLVLCHRIPLDISVTIASIQRSCELISKLPINSLLLPFPSVQFTIDKLKLPLSNAIRCHTKTCNLLQVFFLLLISYFIYSNAIIHHFSCRLCAHHNQSLVRFVYSTECIVRDIQYMVHSTLVYGSKTFWRFYCRRIFSSDRAKKNHIK